MTHLQGPQLCSPMVVSAVCASLLFGVAGAATLACPCYRTTLKGILAIHWVIINWIGSGNVSRTSLEGGATSGSGLGDGTSWILVLALATGLLLLETLAFAGQQECSLSAALSALTFCLLITIDLLVLLLTRTARLETGLVLLAALCALWWMASLSKTSSTIKGFKESEAVNSADLFSCESDPLACLGGAGGGGRMGAAHLAAIIVATAAETTFFTPARWMIGIIFFVRSAATLAMLFTPANFGGGVQAMKRTGRALGSSLAQPDTAKIIMNCVDR